MAKVTALRPARPGRVLVELDGARWRTVPLEVAARVGLSVGLELDRERLRALRRELRRAWALEAATRTLARRDRSETEVRQALERKGVTAGEREQVVASLRGVGVLDDERFALGRAEALAERGLGDSAIVFELERVGIEPDLVAEVLSRLDPERDRAARAAGRRGPSPRTARWLAARGFAPESVEHAVPSVAEEGTRELR
jgi:SOS response regulatory protein OraA/RecX